MTEALLVSNIVLWCLVIVLALAVFALARQVGVLHERVAPAGALLPTSGPEVGEATKAVDYPDLQGGIVTVGGPSPDGKATLILWISPGCPVCRNLVPTARALARDEKLGLLFASDGDRPERHRDYVKELRIDDYPYILSQALGLSFAVSKLPFAALIGPDGILRSKGLVNTREHLESLVISMESGYESLQEYVQNYEQESARTAREHAL